MTYCKEHNHGHSYYDKGPCYDCDMAMEYNNCNLLRKPNKTPLEKKLIKLSNQRKV